MVGLRRSGAPVRADLDYAGLNVHVDQTVARLNELGLGRGDRAGIVLPNGPEMASAFVSIAAATTTAPLNPNYRRKEYDFYLEDLGAKALIVEAGSASEAVASARSLGIAVVELAVPDGARAGEFELSADAGSKLGSATEPGPAGPDDVALVLHTSGTTSPPEDRPPTPSERLCIRQEHPSDAAFNPGGSVPQRHALVSHPWAHGTGSVFALDRCRSHMHTGVQCTEVLLMAGPS